MFKKTYNNPNVVVFLNFDKIVKDDFDFFRSNNVVIEDVNKFNVFKTNPKLEQLFNPTRYNRKSCPVYVYVDMMKILIQYEKMVYQQYDYVIFSDYIIEKSVNMDPAHDNKCKLPTLITKFTKYDLLDQMTVNLLDNFGYLMAGAGLAKEIPQNSYSEYVGFYEKDPDDPTLIKIGNELKNITSITQPENRFLMSKNSYNTIHAIKEYFIDYLFSNYIFNDPSQNNNNIIYEKYIDFYCYLNFLNSITYSNCTINNFDFLHTNNFKENEDYTKISNNEIRIISEGLYLYVIYHEKNVKSYLTFKGIEMIKKFKGYIFPIIEKLHYNNPIIDMHDIKKSTTLLPGKCVPVPGQINSSLKF